MNTPFRVALLVLVAGAGLMIVRLAVELRAGEPEAATPFAPTPQKIERGEYLARAGNCAGCHTARGAPAYSGGRGIETPFGTVYASNLTPDPETGIGRWTPAHFWSALHEGRSRDGHLLYPAFPYPNYTLVTREDSDAIYAYLRTLPAAPAPNRAHALRFPYDNQWALAAWRVLFFDRDTYALEPEQSPEWNRGAYLVRGLGHCSACHGERNLFGATDEPLALSGGVIPMADWYAPSLASPDEAGVATWDVSDIVALLRTGSTPRASVTGPMAEVVYRSLQHLSEADLQAIAIYLRSLPQSSARRQGSAESAGSAAYKRGADIYQQHCADCHGENGRGTPGSWPALAGNRAVTMDSVANPIRLVLSGGYPPATSGNPRPYGMPPFAQTLNDADVAAVLTYVRASWGNSAPEVRPFEVTRHRLGRTN
jgi:mono/diheme cytochrome c family protein